MSKYARRSWNENKRISRLATDDLFRVCATGGVHVCPKCGRPAAQRILNHTTKKMEYKHTRKLRGGPTETTYCIVGAA